MSSRPLLKPFQVVTNGNMASTITSEVTVIDNLSAISYDVAWSGTGCTGSIVVQVSDTYKENPAGTAVLVAGNWNTLPLNATPTITQDTGNGGIDVQITGFNAIRLVYTPTGGTGTMQVFIACKVQ